MTYLRIAVTMVCCIAAPWLEAQTLSGPTFAYILPSNNNAIPLGSGQQIVFPSTAVNATALATFVVANSGSSSLPVSSVSLTGSAFTLLNLPVIPATLGPGQQLQFTISYSPQQVETSTGTITVAAGGNYSFKLNGSGIASGGPSFAYILPSNNNAVPVNGGDPIVFPVTLVNAAATATFVIGNKGSGSIPVSSVSLTGSAFTLLNLPVIPASIGSGQQLQFTLSYSPQQIETSAGSITVAAGGTAYTFKLTGSAIASLFSYQVVAGTGSTPVNPGGPIQFPATAVAASSAITVLATNVSPGSASIASVTVTGAGFQLGATPNFPATAPAGGSIAIAIQFTPATPGALTGTLRVGNDSFVLQGSGSGALLTFGYSSGSSVIPLGASDPVIFPPTQLGSHADLTFTITNTGTAEGTVTSVSIGSAKSPFSTASGAPLPLTLKAGSSAAFTLTFTPQSTGNTSDVLQVDNRAFSLKGAGTAPPALPAYQITGPGGDVAAFQQPSIGVTLASPYPLPISGTLTIKTSPDAFASDPAIQFASGGQSVAFSIPAGQTAALFNGISASDKIQLGTVAGQISITPTFTTTGAFDLTPTSAQALVMKIGRAAPVLLSAQATASGTSAIAVKIIGYATSRSVTGITLNILPLNGATVTSPGIKIDSTAAFTVWYNSAQSAAFGSLFEVTIPLTLQVDVSGTNPLTSIGSIAVSAVNEMGTSNSLTATVQ